MLASTPMVVGLPAQIVAGEVETTVTPGFTVIVCVRTVKGHPTTENV